MIGLIIAFLYLKIILYLYFLDLDYVVYLQIGPGVQI